MITIARSLFFCESLSSLFFTNISWIYQTETGSTSRSLLDPMNEFHKKNIEAKEKIGSTNLDDVNAVWLRSVFNPRNYVKPSSTT